MQLTSYNKEVLENKFLIERLIEKLQQKGDISEDERSEVFLLFRKELLKHHTKNPKEKLEILIEAFAKTKVVQPTPDVVSQVEEESIDEDEVLPEIDTFIKETKPASFDQVIPPSETLVEEVDQKPVQEEKSDKDVLVTQRVENILLEEKNLSSSDKEKARTYLLKEVEAIAHTGVNEKVLDRFVRVSLASFKKKEGLISPPQSSKPAVLDTQPIEKEKQEEKQIPVIPVEKQVEQNTPQINLKKESTPQQIIEPSTPGKEEVQKENVVPEVKEAVVQPAPVSSVTPEVKREVPQEVVQQAVTVPVAESSPVKNEAGFRVHVTSESAGGSQPAAAGTAKKSLAQTMLEQAREADKSNPLLSHQRAVPMPAKRSPTRKFERSEFVPEEKKAVAPKQHVPRVATVDGSGEERLASASNTKIAFDDAIQVESERILERVELRQQQEDLFSKYLKEQLETVVEVVSGSGVVGEEAQQKLRDEIMRDVRKVIKDESKSISEKLRELDHLFTQKRHQYASANQVQASATIEELVDGIMARAGQEVRTNDADADARFRETLRNTLHFKAKHLFGVQMEKNKIQSALDEEYVKHKMFYLKSLK